MTWIMTPAVEELLRKVIERAKEKTLIAFNEEAERIQNKQAAQGRTGGFVGSLMLDAAGNAITDFVQSVLPELLDVIRTTASGRVPTEAAEWVRRTLVGLVDAMGSGLAHEIDRRKTTGRQSITAERLEPFCRSAKRDVDIELSKTALMSLVSDHSDTSKVLRQIDRNPKFNLLVASQRDQWNGAPFRLERQRFLEFASPEIRERFIALDAEAIAALKKLPCLFVYEGGLESAPCFGRIVDITPHANEVRLDYQIIPVTPFISSEDLDKLRPQLQIKTNAELGRRHWDVKECDLAQVLMEKHGVKLPRTSARTTIDITKHQFLVALSFPGEERAYVEQVATSLERHLGENTVFYDFFYKAQLAVPNADLKLQRIYAKQAHLVVVFLSAAYQSKTWCGLEWRVVREKIKERADETVMFVRTDDGAVDGLMSTDGYIDARLHPPDEMTSFITERLAVVDIGPANEPYVGKATAEAESSRGMPAGPKITIDVGRGTARFGDGRNIPSADIVLNNSGSAFNLVAHARLLEVSPGFEWETTDRWEYVPRDVVGGEAKSWFHIATLGDKHTEFGPKWAVDLRGEAMLALRHWEGRGEIVFDVEWKFFALSNSTLSRLATVTVRITLASDAKGFAVTKISESIQEDVRGGH